MPITKVNVFFTHYPRKIFKVDFSLMDVGRSFQTLGSVKSENRLRDSSLE